MAPFASEDPEPARTEQVTSRPRGRAVPAALFGIGVLLDYLHDALYRWRAGHPVEQRAIGIAVALLCPWLLLVGGHQLFFAGRADVRRSRKEQR